MRSLCSNLILTPSGLQSGRIVRVDDQGRVAAVEAVENLDAEAGVEFFPGILMGGMLNAHCHLELSGMRGRIPAGCGFEGFVEGMKSEELRVKSEECAAFWDARMWAEGVSEVWDVCNGDETFELKRGSRIRYHNFCEFFGRDKRPDPNFHNTPHALYSVDPEAFRDLASRNTPLSIHFMESDYEVDDPAAELVRRVPPDREMILVHNCKVTQRDIDIVMGHFTVPVTWVLCPASNRFISGLVPPVELLRKNGLRIAVGTDSLASNQTLSMIRELALLAPHTSAPLVEMLRWAGVKGIEQGSETGVVNLTGVDLNTLSLTEDARTKRIIL